MNKQVVIRVEVETSWIIKNTTLEKSNWKREEIVTQIQHNAQEDSEKETEQVDLSWTSDTVNVNMQRLVKDMDMEAHSEKLMDESDMQVLDEDDRFAAASTTRSKKTARLRKSEFGR